MSGLSARLRALGAGTLACALLAVVPTAHADDWDALWPETRVEDVHAQGIDGSGVKVAVIDILSVDHPGLADADVTHEVGPFDDLDGNVATCTVDGRDLPATVEPGDRIAISGDDAEAGWYYTHATDMLLWLVGNGTDYDGQSGVKGIAPGASVLHLADGVEIPGTTTITPCDGAFGETGVDSGGLVQRAVDWGARIINRSQGASMFDGYDVDPGDVDAYVDALRHGVIMVSGRANDTVERRGDLTGYPVQSEYFPGVITVNSVDMNGTIAPTSDVMDGNVSVVSPGYGIMGGIGQLSPGLTSKNGGTSTAAVILTGYLTLAMQKWPEATGNQIIQSLIRNTKQNDDSPDMDPEHKRGFGEVDPQKLLSIDPTQYPDINPILEYEVKAAAQHDYSKDWYTRDCATSPDPDSMGPDEISCKVGLIGDEYERQRTAWDRVEQCRADGGSDCMRYSATNTADRDAGAAESTASPDSPEPSGLPLWAWGAIGGVAALVVAGGIVLAVVLSKRARKHRYPPVNGNTRPYRPYPQGPASYGANGPAYGPNPHPRDGMQPSAQPPAPQYPAGPLYPAGPQPMGDARRSPQGAVPQPYVRPMPSRRTPEGVPQPPMRPMPDYPVTPPQPAPAPYSRSPRTSSPQSSDRMPPDTSDPAERQPR
ncbi:S8 family serine peptidase [Bifidobacterium pullorum]|uniref:S8 family serine peptidase n=1 Tax=Bifidobacterium pullorum TaxID=78448 RepID=UPI0019571E8F|nr:S8 family serine peptidase [Bifidobacterium pullorum]